MADSQPLDFENSPEHEKLEEQEREEILQEIDKVVAENRLPVSDDLSRLKPQKKGIAFPLLINLFAVAAVLSTFYFSSRMFEQKKETLSVENASYQSAEGRLLEELKKESEEKIKQKDEEIGQIQDELAELDRQSRELAETMDQQIADREAELRAALDAELERERQSLLSQGRSEADIQAELERLEQQRTAEYDRELADFRAETEQAIAEKEEELARAKQLNEELLAEVNSEKEKIQAETRQRETELTAKYEAEKAALAEEAAAAAAEIEQLQRSSAQETLIIDQINGSYDSIFTMMETGNYDLALSAINSLEQLITDPSVATLKAVKNRAETDLNVIDLLRQRIEEQSYKEDVDTKSLAAAADLLLSAREVAKLGDEAYRAGNQAEALDYYTRSLEKIPALRNAWRNLNAIYSESEAGRISGPLQNAEELAAAGELDQAVQKFAGAAAAADAKNPGLLNDAVNRLLETSEQLRLQQQEAASARLAALQTEKDREIEALERQLEQNESDYESSLAQTRSDLEAQIAGLNTLHSEEIASIEADYSDRLAAAENEYRDQLAASEAEYRNELSSAEETYSRQLEDSRNTYETTISEGSADYEDRIAEYESRIAEYEQTIAELEAERDDEIDRLSRLIGERDQENLRLNSENEEINSRLAGLDQQIAELRDSLQQSEAEYSELAAGAEQDSSVQAAKLRTAEQTGFNTGYSQGRYSALQDVISFTSLYTGGTSADSAAGERLASLAENEGLFGQTVQQIQKLAEEGGDSAAVESVVSKQTILIGSISYASGNSVIIEPLTDEQIEVGDSIVIRRKERGKEERYIMSGRITSSTGTRIEAETYPEASGETARSLDLVYISR